MLSNTDIPFDNIREDDLVNRVSGILFIIILVALLVIRSQ